MRYISQWMDVNDALRGALRGMVGAAKVYLLYVIRDDAEVTDADHDGTVGDSLLMSIAPGMIIIFDVPYIQDLIGTRTTNGCLGCFGRLCITLQIGSTSLILKLMGKVPGEKPICHLNGNANRKSIRTSFFARRMMLSMILAGLGDQPKVGIGINTLQNTRRLLLLLLNIRNPTPPDRFVPSL